MCFTSYLIKFERIIHLLKLKHMHFAGTHPHSWVRTYNVLIRVERDCYRYLKKISLSQGVYFFVLQRTFHNTISTVATSPDLIIFTMSSVLCMLFIKQPAWFIFKKATSHPPCPKRSSCSAPRLTLNSSGTSWRESVPGFSSYQWLGSKNCCVFQQSLCYSLRLSLL